MQCLRKYRNPGKTDLLGVCERRANTNVLTGDEVTEVAFPDTPELPQKKN